MAIQTLPFGRSGHVSTRTIFGGAALANVTQEETDRTLELLLQYGVNHIDVSSDYGDAELRVAPWLKRHPDHFYLASKANARTKDKARDELHRSLERMGVESMDLWQLHSLADPIEWDTALSPGGALQAGIEAKQQGLIRAIGITGHGTQIAATIRRSLDRYDFDSVLLPYNFLTMRNPYYAENFNAVVALCEQRGTAVQTIKSIAYRPWMGREHTAAPWYQPLTEQEHIDLAVHWALARPGIFVDTVSDIALLPKVLDAASRFHPGQTEPTEDQMRELADRLQMEPLFA